MYSRIPILPNCLLVYSLQTLQNMVLKEKSKLIYVLVSDDYTSAWVQEDYLSVFLLPYTGMAEL